VLIQQQPQLIYAFAYALFYTRIRASYAVAYAVLFSFKLCVKLSLCRCLHYSSSPAAQLALPPHLLNTTQEATQPAGRQRMVKDSTVTGKTTLGCKEKQQEKKKQIKKERE
jgi:hypothetical protein